MWDVLQPVTGDEWYCVIYYKSTWFRNHYLEALLIYTDYLDTSWWMQISWRKIGARLAATTILTRDTNMNVVIEAQESLYTWWRHQIKTFSALLALCEGNSPVTGEFPTQRPVTRSVDVFFICARISVWDAIALIMTSILFYSRENRLSDRGHPVYTRCFFVLFLLFASSSFESQITIFTSLPLLYLW